MSYHTLTQLWLFASLFTLCSPFAIAQPSTQPHGTVSPRQDGGRKAVVSRHNPHITSVDTLGSLTVGNGGFAVTVDATGLQTFPKHYSHGVPLGTMSNWGWHSFPNTGGYKPEDVWRSYDFGRGHKEVYAVQLKEGRGKAASDYLRVNPHRLHLGCIGFDFDSPQNITDIDQTLNLWTGCIDSRFSYNGQPFHVETVCDPDDATLAARIESNKGFKLLLQFPYPTGGHADDACDWTSMNHKVTVYSQWGNSVGLEHELDGSKYYVTCSWTGKAKLTQRLPNTFILESTDSVQEVRVNFSAKGVKAAIFDNRPFVDVKMAAAGAMAEFWNTGRFIDFGATADPRAKELERRVVLSQYLMNAQECGNMPPQETGLTYNSWFGKFHLEMAWWHLAHWAMWGHLSRLDKPMGWYVLRMDSARSIARRQGFPGVRWMKMTDPLAGEAPSNVGSFLIWQQPEPILLAEQLYQAAGNLERQVALKKYGGMVEETAEFMGSFAQRDADGSYHLRRYIPAQESLNKDSVADSPLELAEWHYALSIAQQWRERAGKGRRADWDSIIARLTPLAYNGDSLYMASATTPNSYTYIKYISDHPAVLGAYGMMPPSRLVDPKIMRKTADWIFANWNWPTSWGWDFPMMAMTYARLGDGEKAVQSLLMDAPKNTYLVNGHNWQSDRLRVYMPGNGGLLAAVALMQDLGAFPKDWIVRGEK